MIQRHFIGRHVTILISLGLSYSLSGCVSASKYNKLEKENEETQQKLATSEVHIDDLEKRLGLASSERTRLEGSVSEMKTALADLQKRRQETEKRLAEYREVTAKFSELVNSGKLSIKMVNGRMTVALSSDILFPSGSAKLSPSGIIQIKEVTQVLKDLEGRNFQIEGHTDNVPISTSAFASNWELASARALTVLNRMVTTGMPADRISAASYGDTQPAGDNSTPEGRKINRRIAIVIVPDLSALPGYEELNRLSEAGSQTPTEKQPSQNGSDE